MKVGIVSGYFNPIHKGHIEYIKASKLQCDAIIAIVNNDKQVEAKGSQKFMDEDHRAFIVQNIKDVDLSIVSIDDDLSIANTIQDICTLNHDGHELLFFNSGDRDPTSYNEKEEEVCKKYNIKQVFIKMTKKYSSSKLKT